MTPPRLAIWIASIAFGLAVCPGAGADPLPPQIHTIAGGGTCSGSALGGNGKVPAAGLGPAASGGSCDNKKSTSVTIGDAQAVATLPGGAYLYVDSVNNLVREVSAKGFVTTVAGNGSTTDQDGIDPTQSGLNDPVGVSALPDGGFLITEYQGGVVRRVLPGPEPTIETIAGTGGQAGAPASGVSSQTPLSYPTDAEVTDGGQVLITESGSGLIRELSSADPSASIQTVAGGGSCDDRSAACEGTAAGSVALHDPTAISLVNGGDGGYLVAEADPNGANAIRRVTQISPSAPFTTVAGQPGHAYGFAGDGGPATSALLYSPSGVTSLPGGGFLISDTGNERVREVSPSGVITTIAGNGTATYSGDGGAATDASLQGPTETAPTTGFGVIIADASNGAIREITIPPTTTITFQPAPPPGHNGWYEFPPTAAVTTSPGAKINCELDPVQAPPAYSAITSGCPFASSSPPLITGDGIHTIYAAAANAFGDQEIPVSATIKLDGTTPTVTCQPPPSFVVGSQGARVSAVVADPVSGPAQPVVSARVRTTAVGRHTATLEGQNQAGTQSFADCPYFVTPLALRPDPAFGWSLLSGSHFALVKHLALIRLASGVTVSVRCGGSGCPFASAVGVTGRRCRHRHPCLSRRPLRATRRLELSRLFAGDRLSPRAVLSVSVTAPETVGRKWTLVLRAGRRPTERTVCLAPGSTTRSAVCPSTRRSAARRRY